MCLLFEKYFCSFRICFIISAFLMLCSFSSFAQMSKDSFNTKSGTIIMFEQFDKEYYQTLQYLKYADRMISSYLNSSNIDKKYTCRILVLKAKVRGGINLIESSKIVSIYLNKDFRTAKNKFDIIGKMINAMLLTKAGFKPNDVNISLPPWIIVGIYGKLQQRFTSHSILPVSYFPGLKALSQAEKLPNFRVSITSPLDPEKDGTAYQLYEELCRFIMLELKVLSSRTDNPIADLIFLTARKKYSDNEVFDSTIVRAIVKNYDKTHRVFDGKYKKQVMPSGKKVQAWFVELTSKRLVNMHSPIQTKFFRQRFKRFRKFTYSYQEKNKAPEKMIRDISRLDVIYLKYDMNEGFKEMMNKKFVELDALIFASQPLAKKSLEKIRKTLQQFDKMSSIVIIIEIKKALVQLEKDLDKQQKIEDYLRKIEYTNIAPAKLYRNELIENKRSNRKYYTGISKYLNKVEEKFLQD